MPLTRLLMSSAKRTRVTVFAFIVALLISIQASAGPITMTWSVGGEIYPLKDPVGSSISASGSSDVLVNPFSQSWNITGPQGATASASMLEDDGALKMAVSAASNVGSQGQQAYMLESMDFREEGTVNKGGQFLVTFVLSAASELTGSRTSCVNNFPVNSFSTDAFLHAQPQVFGGSGTPADFDLFTNLCGGNYSKTFTGVATFGNGASVIYRNYLLIAVDAYLGTALLDASQSAHLYVDPITPGASISWASGDSHLTPAAVEGVPEPASILLLGTGLVGAYRSRIRRTSHVKAPIKTTPASD